MLDASWQKKTEGKCLGKQFLVASMQLMYVHPVAVGLEASSGGTATARVESQATGSFQDLLR